MSKHVKDGELLYTTPSALATADPAQFGGCLRKWFYVYVEGRREPTNLSQQIGIDGHDQVEHYLFTAEDVLGRIPRAGKRFIPYPGDDLIIEHKSKSELELDGTPISLRVDLAHFRSQYITPECESRDMPLGGVEVIDWKFTGDLKYAKPPDTVQMVAYGNWALAKCGDRPVRLSHVYFQTRGRLNACKTTRLYLPDTLRNKWASAIPVVRNMREAAVVKRADEVEPNPKSCGAYGKCPHRAYCTAGQDHTLEQVFGKGGAMNLLEKMGLPPATPVAPPTPDTVFDLTSQMAALVAEEKAAAPKINPVDAAWGIIVSAERGAPTLGGEAAKEYAAATGIVMSGAGFAGSGDFGKLHLMEAGQIEQLATELVARGKVPGAVPVAAALPPDAHPPAMALPPDAPASDPAKATNGLPASAEGVHVPPMPAAPPGTVIPTTMNMNVAVVPPAIDKSLTKMKKAELIAEVDRLRAEAAADATITVTPAAAPPGLELFVDAVPQNVDFESLDPYVDELCKVLCEQYDAADVRCAPQEGPLGFGKWKGAVAALAKAKPPAPGRYFIDIRGREVAEVVADALRGSCSLYVRGVR